MKITDIKTFVVDCFRTNWVFVKVYTDEGICGVGEGTLEYKETYAYELTSDYRKETMTVVGGENNPSVVTSTYYDVYGDKTKTELGSDYETYTSDYVGNIISVKSPKANNEGLSAVSVT